MVRSPGSTASGTPVRVGHLSTAYHTAPLLLGTGWVDEATGRKTSWHLFPTGPDIVNRMERRELEFGYIGLTPAMIGIGRGVPISCIAGGHVEGTAISAKGSYCTIAEYGGDLRATLAQFKGKALGTPKRGNIHEIIARHHLAECGLENDVEVRNFDSAELIAEAMARDEVEGGSATPCLFPYLGFFRSRFEAKVVVPPSYLWPYNPSYGLFARRDLIEEQPDLVRAFLSAHKRAATFLRERPRAAAEIVADAMELVDGEYVLQAFRISPKYCIALPQEYIDATLRFVEPLRGLGYLQRDLSAEDIFDRRFLEELHPEPHHYNDQPNWAAE